MMWWWDKFKNKHHDQNNPFCRYTILRCTCGFPLDSVDEEEESQNVTMEEERELLFYDDNTVVKLSMNRTVSVMDMCDILAPKFYVFKDYNMTIYETWVDLKLERALEDHEKIMITYASLRNFSYHATITYRFGKNLAKYEFFRNPHQFFPRYMLDIQIPANEEEDRVPEGGVIQHKLVTQSRCPDVISQVLIQEDSKKWKKMYMLLRDQDLLVSVKKKSLLNLMRAPLEIIRISKTVDNPSLPVGLRHIILPKEVQVFANISRYYIYTAKNAKVTLQAPTDYCIVLRPTGAPNPSGPSQSRSPRGGKGNLLRSICLETEKMRSCWVISLRLAKYGRQLRDNFEAFKARRPLKTPDLALPPHPLVPLQPPEQPLVQLEQPQQPLVQLEQQPQPLVQVEQEQQALLKLEPQQQPLLKLEPQQQPLLKLEPQVQQPLVNLEPQQHQQQPPEAQLQPHVQPQQLLEAQLKSGAKQPIDYEEDSHVPMDFSDGDGKIISDPDEARAVAFGEGQKWRRRMRFGLTRSETVVAGPSKRHVLENNIHLGKPWYFGNMPRDRADFLVSQQGTIDGVFLVRDSRSNPGDFVITYSFNRKAFHLKVTHYGDTETGQVHVSVDGGITRFLDLERLVEFYRLNHGILPTTLNHHIGMSVTTFKVKDGISRVTLPKTSKNPVAGPSKDAKSPSSKGFLKSRSFFGLSSKAKVPAEEGSSSEDYLDTPAKGKSPKGKSPKGKSPKWSKSKESKSKEKSKESKSKESKSKENKSKESKSKGGIAKGLF